MEYSEYLNLKLPSSSNNADLADISVISENFRKLDAEAEKSKKQIEQLNKGGLLIKEDFIEEQVNKWLDEHPEATTIVQDGSLTLKKLKPGDLFYTPQMFGEIGTGDDRQAIEKAVASLTDNSTLVFPKGHYVIKSVPDDFEGTPSVLKKHTLFEIKNKKNILIDLNGSIIEFAIKNFNNPRYSIFSFLDCENFTIKNGALIGERLTHDYSTFIYGKKENKTHEWGTGIEVNTVEYPSGATSENPATPSTTKKCGGKIQDLEIYNFTGDGITIINGISPSLVKIVDCDIHHCRRQGITLGDSADTIIDNCYIHHIGTHDGILGANPQAGIDIEAQSGTFSQGYIDIRNTRIENTTGYCIVCSPIRIKDENGNLQRVSYITEKILINNCEINGVCIFAGWQKREYDGVAISFTPVSIRNSVITHGIFKSIASDKTTLEESYKGHQFNNTEIINCVLNSYNKNIYPEPIAYSLFGNENTETPIIKNSVINLLFPRAKIRSGEFFDTIINGGTIVSLEQSINSSRLKDCTNVVFNECLFYVEYARKLFKFVFCRFNNCGLTKEDTGTLAIRNCYLDTRVFKNANYVNCTIEDEIDTER